MSLIGIILVSYIGIGMLIGFIWVHYEDFSFHKNPEEAKGGVIISMTFLWGYVFTILFIYVIWFINKGAEKIIKKYDNEELGK